MNETSQRIAALNDEFRRSPFDQQLGKTYTTDGVAALGPEAAAGNATIVYLNDSSGDFKIMTAPTGSAGAVATVTDRFHVTNAGSVGIGTTTPTAQFSTTGTVRFSNFGAGTLTTDASGNLSVPSDERLKNIQGSYTRGLADIEKLNPILYHWNGISGLDQSTLYAGFSAQNVLSAIPEAVGSSNNGYLTLQDRPVIATAVNAIKEIASITDTFKSNLVAWLGADNNGVVKVRTDELCVGTTCVTPEQFQAMVAASAANSNSPAPHLATSSATLILNGNNPSQWTLNTPWSDNLGALFTHDGISETIYATSTIDGLLPGTITIDYWAHVPTTGSWLHTTRDVVIPAPNDNPQPFKPTGTSTP